MGFPQIRLRRLRQNENIRDLVRETELNVSDFIAPLFAVCGSGVRRPIRSLPGQFHLSSDVIAEEALQLAALGIKSTLLFGIPETKDDLGSSACDSNGVVQRAIRAIKKEVPQFITIADLCFCEYTSHGHCGPIVNNDVDNDRTLELLARQAVSLADAGVDIVAPSGMMDGVVGTLRRALDDAGHKQVAILSYSAKFASAFYGPFREAVDSTPSFGDRRSYQMDPANGREALREVALDVEEGADMIMIKPALAYLDIIANVRQRFDLPIAAYNVSGEYAMVKKAAEAGLIDGERVMLESLTAIKRAGADLIISYFAKEFAEHCRKG